MRGFPAVLAIVCAFTTPAAGSDNATSARSSQLGKVKLRPPDGERRALAGINFPPNQGNTNNGSMCRGPYHWGYTNAQIAAANAHFNAMRLPINQATANDPEALETMKHYVDQFAGKHAIIAMVDISAAAYDSCDHNTSQGDGSPDHGVPQAWAKIHAVFKDYPNVHYEIFNEPHAFSKETAREYVRAMRAIIHDAKLPEHRCILDGVGFANDIQAVAAAGWAGDLGYHFYPFFLNKNRPDLKDKRHPYTQSAYSNLVQSAIGSLGNRTWVTEFGASLGYSNRCYDTFDTGDADAPSQNINALRGLDDALRALRTTGRGVKGVFYWHGRHNDDSYDFWSSKNAQGACKVREIESNA